MTFLAGGPGFTEVTLRGLSNSIISYKLDLSPSKCSKFIAYILIVYMPNI